LLVAEPPPASLLSRCRRAPFRREHLSGPRAV